MVDVACKSARRLSGAARLAGTTRGRTNSVRAARMPAPMPAPGCGVIVYMWVYVR